MFFSIQKWYNFFDCKRSKKVRRNMYNRVFEIIYSIKLSDPILLAFFSTLRKKVRNLNITRFKNVSWYANLKCCKVDTILNSETCSKTFQNVVKHFIWLCQTELFFSESMWRFVRVLFISDSFGLSFCRVWGVFVSFSCLSLSPYNSKI